MNYSNSTVSTVIRANQNGIMYRHCTIAQNGADLCTYSIYDNRGQCTTYAGTDRKNMTRNWNRNYRNSRQYSTSNGVNHRYA